MLQFLSLLLWCYLKGTNVSELQEAIITQAELMELKGDPIGLVEGSVVESKTDPGRGWVFQIFLFIYLIAV